MSGCCSQRALPDRLELWEFNKTCTVQRKKAVADGASENTHGEIDYTSDSNWMTLTSATFAIRTKSGRQVDALGNIVDVTLAFAYCAWSNATGAITPSHRLIYGSKTYQITSAINVNEDNDWMKFGIAELEVDH